MRLIAIRSKCSTKALIISTIGYESKESRGSLPACGKSSLSGATGITVARECAADELPTLAEHPIFNDEYDRRYST